MKITRDKALAVTAYCRRHNLNYVGEGQYPNSVKAGLRAGTKAPGGVSIHLPRGHKKPEDAMRWPQKRAYVLWQGESIEAIEDACAFILMTTKRDLIYIVRCKHVSSNGDPRTHERNQPVRPARCVLHQPRGNAGGAEYRDATDTGS